MNFIKKNPITSALGLSGFSILMFLIAASTKAILLSLGLGLVAGAAALYLAFTGSKTEGMQADGTQKESTKKLGKIAMITAGVAIALSVLSPAVAGGSLKIPGVSSGPSKSQLATWKKDNEAFFSKHMAAGHAVSISLTDMTALDPKTQKVIEKIDLHGGRINTQTGQWTYLTDAQRKAEEAAAKAAAQAPAPAPAPAKPASTPKATTKETTKETAKATTEPSPTATPSATKKP